MVMAHHMQFSVQQSASSIFHYFDHRAVVVTIGKNTNSTQQQSTEGNGSERKMRLVGRRRTGSTVRAAAKPLVVLWAASAICSALVAVLLASRSFYLQQQQPDSDTSTGAAEEGRHHHRRRACDDHARWVAKMASLHNASLVLTVDRRGCANFTSLQEAVDAVPDRAAARTLIAVDAGVYAEKVVVRSAKTGVTVQGRGNLATTVAWNGTANSSGGTFASATFAVLADGFVAYKATTSASRTPPAPPSRAVALRVAGDQAAFYWCGFYGSQDTQLDERGRHLFRECYVRRGLHRLHLRRRALPLPRLHHQLRRRRGRRRRCCHGERHGARPRLARRQDGLRVRALQRRGHGAGVARPAVGRLRHRRLRQDVSRRRRRARGVERLERPRQAADGALRRVRLHGPRRQRRRRRAEGGVREAASGRCPLCFRRCRATTASYLQLNTTPTPWPAACKFIVLYCSTQFQRY